MEMILIPIACVAAFAWVTENDGLYTSAVLVFLVLALFIFGTQDARAEGAYISGAVAVHSEAVDAPEIGLWPLLGQVEVGYREGNFVAFAQHTSAIMQFERGYGLNMVGVRYVYEF